MNAEPKRNERKFYKFLYMDFDFFLFITLYYICYVLNSIIAIYKNLFHIFIFYYFCLKQLCSASGDRKDNSTSKYNICMVTHNESLTICK